MMFWLREILGWLLVALGLGVFWIAMQLLLREGPLILEAPAFIAIGFIVFRGGLHMLKVSVAGQVCLQAHKEALRADQGQRRGT
jgi:hypothetical protein